METTTTILCTHKTNVEEYYNIMLQKKNSIIEIYQVKIYSNATNIKHIEPLNDKFFNHINKIALKSCSLRMLTHQKEL